jgi:hypothetical protein
VNKLRRELVDQLQRGERQSRGAIALGLGQPIDNAFGAEQFQPLEGERRASTVPQQPLQAVAILRAVYAAIVHEELVVRPLYSRVPYISGGKRANTTTRLEHSALDGYDKRDDSR